MLCASFAEHVVDALAAALRGDGVADVKHQLRAVAILHISGKFVAVEELLRDLAERGVKGDALRHDPWSAGADGVSAGDARAARKAKRARRAGFVDAMRVKLEQLLVSYCATRWDELDALAAANGSEELAAAEAYAAEVVANAIAAAHADRTRRSVGSMRVQADQLRKMSKSSVELAAAAVATAAQAAAAAAAARRGRPSLLSASTRAKVRSATNKVLSMHVERKLSQQRKWAEIVEMGLEMKKRRRQSIAGAVLVRGSIDRQLVDATSSSLARRASAGRQPVLLMIGGGMSAGKSTAVKTMLSSSDFWRTHQASAVTVEADKFKMHDPVFQALTSTFHRGGGAAKLVHSHSTEAAEKLFIHAVNEARDIVFDGTMSWRPFVEQVVAMVRDGRFDYARGRGWIAPAAEGGAAVEEYFVRVATPRAAPRPAYRVEVLGVTCALDVAVARALRRTLETGRGVPLRSQLRSHRLFAESFPRYVALADQAFLYDSTTPLATPVLVASSAEEHEVSAHHPQLYGAFLKRARLDEGAKSIEALFPASLEASADASAEASAEAEGGAEGGDVATLEERIASTLPEIAAHFATSVGRKMSGGRRFMLKKSLSFVAEDEGAVVLEEEEEEADDDE